MRYNGVDDLSNPEVYKYWFNKEPISPVVSLNWKYEGREICLISIDPLVIKILSPTIFSHGTKHLVSTSYNGFYGSNGKNIANATCAYEEALKEGVMMAMDAMVNAIIMEDV